VPIMASVCTCTTPALESFLKLYGISEKNTIYFIHNFLCILCLDCIYYETDLRDNSLYNVVSYPSLMLREPFHTLRVVHVLKTLLYIQVERHILVSY
jgi:hypothetical protein